MITSPLIYCRCLKADFILFFISSWSYFPPKVMIVSFIMIVFQIEMSSVLLYSNTGKNRRCSLCLCLFREITAGSAHSPSHLPASNGHQLTKIQVRLYIFSTLFCFVLFCWGGFYSLDLWSLLLLGLNLYFELFLFYRRHVF